VSVYVKVSVCLCVCVCVPECAPINNLAMTSGKPSQQSGSEKHLYCINPWIDPLRIRILHYRNPEKLFLDGLQLKHITCAILVSQSAQVLFLGSMHESTTTVITNQWSTAGIQCVGMEERSELSLCPCVTAPRGCTSLPITGRGVYFFGFYPNKQTKN